MTYRRARVAYRRDVYYIACLLAVMIGAVFCIWGPGGYRDLKRMQMSLDADRTRLEILKRSNGERMQRIQELQFNRRAQEKFLREKDYAIPGELILHLPPEQPGPSATGIAPKPQR